MEATYPAVALVVALGAYLGIKAKEKGSSVCADAFLTNASEGYVVKASSNWKAPGDDNLSFKKGAKIVVLDQSTHGSKLFGKVGEELGWFPSLYVKAQNEKKLSKLKSRLLGGIGIVNPKPVKLRGARVKNRKPVEVAAASAKAQPQASSVAARQVSSVSKPTPTAKPNTAVNPVQNLQKKGREWSEKLGKSLKGSKCRPSPKRAAARVFGRPLGEQRRASGFIAPDVPDFLVYALHVLRLSEPDGLDTEGIFRVSGEANVINSIITAIENGKPLFFTPLKYATKKTIQREGNKCEKGGVEKRRWSKRRKGASGELGKKKGRQEESKKKNKRGRSNKRDNEKKRKMAHGKERIKNKEI